MLNYLQIAYFPYLFLGNRATVDFDKITVWNFSILKSQRIANVETREHITKLIGSNQRLGKPIEDVGIISTRKNEDYAPLSQAEQQKIEDLRRVLFLCSVAKSNIRQGPNVGHFMSTSDNFSVVYQNFQIGVPDTSYQSGRMVAITSGGHEIEKVTFEAPRHILNRPFNYDEELLKAMSKLKRKNSVVYRRILRAIDAMMNGYTNSDDVSNESRILEQARAFEILFDLPEAGQRKMFKEKIAQCCQGDEERKRRYLSERPQGKKEWEINTRQVMWADRFYVLRNHIIHGEKLNNNSFLFFEQSHHAHLGLWFFLVSIKNMINEAFDNKSKFHDTIRYKSGRFEYENGALIRAIERAVGEHII